MTPTVVSRPVPVPLGVGFALKYRETRHICVCYFDDGAINQGGVHDLVNRVDHYTKPVL